MQNPTPSKRMKIDSQVKPVTKTKVIRRNKLALMTPPDLSEYAICWVKIRGFKDWPAVIERCVNGSYEVHFFGDYTRAKVGRNKITNFYEGFSLFHATFDAPKLSKAIKEASICLMSSQQQNPPFCFVCSILDAKKK